MDGALFAHMRAEEDVLYKLLAAADRSRSTTLQAEEDHRELAARLETLRRSGTSGDAGVPELRQLQACLQRHVIEEESELFAHAQVVFDPPQLRMLAAEFTAAKKRYSPLPVGW